MKLNNLFIIFIPFLCSGCAAMTTGTNQSISITTNPVQGATCQLSNDKGSWYIPSTPASVTVNRSYSDLSVNCKSDNKNGVIKVTSTTKNLAWGNILLGGVIGGAVDVGTGAAYDYPTVIHVPLF